MVIRVDEQGTVYENSPKKTQADVRHEFVPEIRIASRILNEPETLDKLKEVSQRLKEVDFKYRGKVHIPAATTQSEEIGSGQKRKRGSLIESSPPRDDVRIEQRSLFISDRMQFSYVNYVLDDQGPARTPDRGWMEWFRSVLLCCWPKESL